MRTLFILLSSILVFAYPLIIYFGISRFGLSIVGVIFLIIFIARILMTKKTKIKELRSTAMMSSITGIVLITLSFIFKHNEWLTFYPVIVNIGMLSVFTFSLTQTQSIIEKFARLQHDEISDYTIKYTRKVTIIWCLFFVINASIALYTCFQPLEIWALYNGLVSYILIGSIITIEWLVRPYIHRYSN